LFGKGCLSLAFNSEKMVTCTFFIINGFKLIRSKCLLNKWKKVREPPTMIKRSKARIPNLAMQRQNPMDARVEGRKKHC
jgi:hypothetical protein